MAKNVEFSRPPKITFHSWCIYIWDRTLFVPYIYFIDKTSSSCAMIHANHAHGENKLIFNEMFGITILLSIDMDISLNIY